MSRRKKLFKNCINQKSNFIQCQQAMTLNCSPARMKCFKSLGKHFKIEFIPNYAYFVHLYSRGQTERVKQREKIERMFHSIDIVVFGRQKTYQLLSDQYFVDQSEKSLSHWLINNQCKNSSVLGFDSSHSWSIKYYILLVGRQR